MHLTTGETMLFWGLFNLIWGVYQMAKKNEVIVATRTLIDNNGSLYVNAPKGFVDRHGLQAGDKVVVVYGENMKISTMEKPK